jgi:hypothetical protein
VAELVEQREYAKQRMLEALAGESHFAPYELIFRHGFWFEPRIRPAEVPPGEKRFCFRNAFRLAATRPDLHYVEGYGVSTGGEGMPSRHAWCIDRVGRVFDPTWGDPERPLTVLALRGIVLPLDFVQPYVDHDYLHCGTLERLADNIDSVTDALGLPPIQ